MKNLIRKLSVVFSAGAFGGLVNSVSAWLFGALGITALLGVKLAPHFSEFWLYSRICWGGVWGVLFLLPFLKGGYVLRGVILSIAPTLVQLFIVFPFQLGKGLLGLELGVWTPLFVLIFNALWGCASGLWLRAAKE